MFKRDLIIPILLFALFTLKQLIFNNTISWIDNAGIAMFIFLLCALGLVGETVRLEEK